MNNEIRRAGRILFGNQVRIDEEFLYRDLDLSIVKTAFRKIALISHPDRHLQASMLTQERHKRRFMEAYDAYEILLDFLENRMRLEIKPSRPAQPKPRPKPTRPAKSKAQDRSKAQDKPQAKPQKQTASPGNGKPYQDSFFYRGRLPNFHLRFAEYLYYAGAIPWHGLIQSIVWQRQQRPRFGDIARGFQYLTQADVIELLRGKDFREQIGMTAQRLNLLDEQRVKMVLWYQRYLQKPIGSYFVENNLISTEKLEMMYRSFLRHNASFHVRN